MSNEKPLTKDQQVEKTAQSLQARYGFNTLSGRTKALYEGSKHDDILFSKKYKDTLMQSKRDGLISSKDAQRIGSYMADRAVELANNGQASGFTPEGEYKPWVSKADMRKQRQSAKTQYGEDMEQVAAADRAQMAASGYRPEDLQNEGFKLPQGTPFAGGYEMPITGAGFAKDPMRELGIYGQQVAQGIVGGQQGLSQIPQALGARMMGQDPSAVVQEGTPGFEAGQVTGQRFAGSVAALPITVPAMSGGGAAGSAIGGGIGGLLGPGGRVAGQVIGGFLGGAAGAYGGHYLANLAGTGAMNMLLGQAANAKLSQKQNEMADKYPLAARYGESALEVSMFAPRIKPEGFSTRLAAQGYKQSGLGGLRQGITDQGAFLNSFVEGGGEGALSLWQAKKQSDREKELGMPGKSAMDILAEGAFGALFQRETKFGKKVFGTLSGRDFIANRANAMPQFNPTSVEGLAGKAATAPSTGVDTATMTPEGWKRINLGGRIKGGVDKEGNPIVTGARYAVYNPTERKASIYTDNDFALTGERTRNAAFNLTVADNLFKHNPIMGYKDPVEGVQRTILGITRDAGVRVRDINNDLTSTIKVVPLSEIRDKKVAKRIDEVMQEQGVLANKAPAPHTPEAFANADKIAFPDEVALDEGAPVAARVVSQIGKKSSNMYVVALPDGSHIRANGGSINVGKPGSVLVRGKLSEGMFPTSLSDLVAPKGGLENQAFIKDGEDFHHLQLTPDQKSIYARVKSSFAAEIRAAKDEPDDARREAMIGIVKNKMGEEFARVATIAAPSGKFKDADVIDINLEQSKFKGVPQTAIVVGRNKFGYQVRLVDHDGIGEFTVPESLIAGYDPSMGMPDAETNFEGPTADGTMPKSAMPGPGTVPIGRPLGPGPRPKTATSVVREGESPTVDVNPDADNVDFHELPEPIRARINNTLTRHGNHIKGLGIGNAITINENSANAIHDITIKRIDPTSWQYTLRTSDVDPKSRVVTNQFVSDYTLTVDEKTGDIVATIGKPTDQGQQGQQTPVEIKTEADAAKALKATEFVGRHQVRFLDLPVQVFKKKPDGTGFLVGPNNKPVIDSTLIKTPVYDSNGRKIVVAQINGVRVPFYLSTGAAGKKTVASGKWYPFFGIAPSDDSPGGWLNKGSEAAINDYYGSSHLKEVAQHLDQIVGDIRNVKTTTSFGFRADGTRNKVFDFINQGLNPTENKKASTASDFAANVKNVIDALESAAPAIVGGQTVMAYQTDSEAEAGGSSAQQFEPGSTTRGRAAMARRYLLGRVNVADIFAFKRERTAIEQDPSLSQAEKERKIIELNNTYKRVLDEVINKGIFNLNRISTEARLPEGMQATGSREERYGYKIKAKEGNDLTQLQYAETEPAGINDKEVVQTAVKMGKNTFLLNAIRVSNKRQFAAVLAEQYKVKPEVASYIADIVDRFARGWALDKVNEQVGRAHDLFESTGKLQEHLANRKPGEYADTRGMYFRQFARTEPEVNKAVSEFMREFYRERFAAFAVLDQATEYDDKYRGAIFRAVKENNTAFNVIVGFSSRNVSTAVHEIAHALLRGMSDKNKGLVIERFHHAARAKDNKLPLDIEEAWAGAFEAALMRGQFPQNYAAQKAFKDFSEKDRLLYDPVLQNTWEEVGRYLNGVRELVIKKRDEAGLPTNAEFRSGQVFWEAPYKPTERLFKDMSIEVMLPGGVKEFGVVMKAQAQTGLPVQVRLNSGSVQSITPSQITRIAGWSDGFNSAVLDLVANLTRQNYTQHMRELQASNPELFAGFSKNKPTITGSYDTELGTSPRKIAFQTNVENQLNQDRWFATKEDVASVKKGVSGLVNSGRVVLDAEGKVTSVLDQNGKPSFAYSVLQTVNGYTPEAALAMYAITETPEYRKWSGGKPLVEAVFNTDVRADMPVGQLMSEERVMIRQMMAGVELLKALKAAHRGDRTDDLIADIEVLSKDYYGYNTPDAKKAAEMAEFYTSDTDEANVALTGLISALDYEINKSTKFDMIRPIIQSSNDYRAAMRKPRTGTGFVTMAFHPNNTHAWLPSEGGYIIPNGVSGIDGVGRGGAYIRLNNPLVVDLKNNGMATDRVAKYKAQAKAAGRDSVVLLNVRHSVGGTSTLHNMVIPMNNHPLRVMDSMGKINLSTFFSGGGLIEAGSKNVATPIKAVEFDKNIASVYRSNHGDHVEVGDVRNVDIASMVGTEWFHASPVCKNYSIASTAKTESNEDITTAKAVVDVVDRIHPPVVTIENVRQYDGTEAFNMIIDALDRNGYNHQTAVYKTSDFAGSTMRERLLIRATRGFALPPITQNKLYKAKSWYEAVEDLIDDMPIGQLTQQQAKQFTDRGMDLATIDQPYLVQSTSKGAPQKMYGPAYTVMAGTGQAMRIVLPGGIVKVVTDRALARWQGLPDSYVLPNAHTLANKVVGNGVPTELTKYVLAPVAEAYMKHKAKQTAQTAMGETMMAFQSVDDIELARSTQGKVEYAQFDPAMYGDAISKTGKRLSDNADFIQKSAALADVRPGQMIATRLNINFLQNFRVPIQSVHATTASATRPYDGKVIAYSHAITVNNPSFVVDQKAVHDISSGVKTKFPMAAVMGEYVKTATDKHLVSGEELRFNPKDTNLFVDSQGRPVKSVRGTVTAYGTKVYVHPGGQIEYWGADAPQRYVAPQTEMAFQSTGEDEIAFESPYDLSMAMGNRVYRQTASPGAPSTVTRIMPRSSPSGYGRWWAAVDFLNDVTRMVLSGDLAFTTLQAGIIGLSNPKVGFAAFVAGLKGFAPNMQIVVNGQKIGTRKFGREVYHQVGDQMRANPAYELAREAGLKLQMFEIDERFNDMRQVELANLRNEDPTATLADTKTTLMDVDELGTNDEWYMKNRLTAHLPGQGQFERYNSILHDTILLTQFDNWYKTLLSQGYEPGSAKFTKAMQDSARILNVSIGDIQYSTDTTKDAAASRIAKVLFTAPRWLMSRALIDPFINTGLSNLSWVRDVMGHDNPVFDLYKNGSVDPEVRKLGLSMWLRVAGAQIAMMLMAILYQNWSPDVEANADKSFGRVRVGDFRFDPPSGIFDHYRLGIRLYQAMLSTDPKNVQKAEKSGVPLWYYQVQDLQKEIQYKSSPLVNTVVSMFGGNDPAAFFGGIEGIQNAQAKSVVGEAYYGTNEPAQFFYDSFIKERVRELFGSQVADNGGFSNAFIERLPTVFPQFMDAYYRAYEYDRPPLAYALANMIPNFLGLKVEVTPAEYLKDRVKDRNEVTESPNILRLIAEGEGRKVFTGQ